MTVSLATPTVTRHGAYPPGFGPEALEGDLAGCRVRLVAAVVGGSLPLGGWDLAVGAPKPLRRALPAGSVFFFEPRDRSAAEVAARVHGSAWVDDLDPHQKLQGFGLAVAGCSPRED